MKRMTVILAAGALAGCVSTATPPEQPETSFKVKTVQERQAGLVEVHSWYATGAISIQQAQRSPVIMRYEWRQQGPDHYRIDLAASLNLAAVSITGTPQRVTLQKGNEPPVSAPTPEQLMQRSLGWSLPIPSFWYWARGLPAPGANEGTQYDKFGHLVSLRQKGWQVTFSGYHTIQGVDLPDVIELHRADIAVKLVIKQWQINPRA